MPEWEDDLKVGKIKVHNRVAMASMGRSRND